MIELSRFVVPSGYLISVLQKGGAVWRVELTEFRLNLGEVGESSISLLSSSSKSVSKTVAVDIGRGASAFMLKNESVCPPFWNISTRWSIGVMASMTGYMNCISISPSLSLPLRRRMRKDQVDGPTKVR